MLAILFSACTSPSRKEGTQEVTLSEQLSISLPAYLEKNNELHDFAELQYAYEDGAFYVLGLKDSKAQLRNKHLYYNLEDYTYYSLDNISARMDSAEVGEVAIDTVNGLRRMAVDINGYIVQQNDSLQAPDSLSIFYKVAVYETPTEFVQLFLWTHQELLPDFERDMDGILASLHDPATKAETEALLAGEEASGSSAECAEC